METFETIQKRCSIRQFSDKEIPEDKLMRVLEAARLAPSGSNQQAWKFIVVKDQAKIQALSHAAMDQAQVAMAPVVIVAVALNPERMMMCEVPAYAVDLSIAIDHMTLAAADIGLGTCWIGAFKQSDARKIVGVPDSCKIVTLLPLGFPAAPGRAKARKTMAEIVCYDTFKA
jgi:nitroreductase